MPKKKTALITGVTGQDGSLLTEFLLKKYRIIGVKRRSSSFNTQRIDHIYNDIKQVNNFIPYYGDLNDSTNLLRIIQATQPDEIYNLGAQSHVHTSFETPEYTANSDGLGTLRLLEAIRILKLEKKLNFIKLPPLKFLEITLYLKMKKLLLGQEVLTQFQNYILIGPQ